MAQFKDIKVINPNDQRKCLLLKIIDIIDWVVQIQCKNCVIEFKFYNSGFRFVFKIKIDTNIYVVVTSEDIYIEFNKNNFLEIHKNIFTKFSDELSFNSRCSHNYGVTTCYYPQETSDETMVAYSIVNTSSCLGGKNIVVDLYTQIDKIKYDKIKQMQTQLIELICTQIMTIEPRNQLAYYVLFQQILEQIKQLVFEQDYALCSEIKKLNINEASVIRTVNGKPYDDMTPIICKPDYWTDSMEFDSQDHVFNKQQKVVKADEIL
jgi:hypothetical protein